MDSATIGYLVMGFAVLALIAILVYALVVPSHQRVIPNTILDGVDLPSLPPGVNPEDVEAMRRILQAHAGIDISELHLKDGYWMARTAKGDIAVSSILKGEHKPGRVIR